MAIEFYVSLVFQFTSLSNSLCRSLLHTKSLKGRTFHVNIFLISKFSKYFMIFLCKTYKKLYMDLDMVSFYEVYLQLRLSRSK